MVPRLALLGVAMVLAGASPSCRAREQDPVILELGRESVRRSDFERYVKDLEARGGAVDPSVRKALLDPFLEERILVLEARSKGLLAAGASAENEAAAVQKLLVDEVLSKVKVEEDDVARHFAEHTADFKVPESVTLRQILLPNLSEARDVRRRVRSDPKSFDTLARTRSRAPEASTGGVMGTFSRGQLPEALETAAFALATSGTSDVVETTLGFHVLRVDARTPARERPLDECRAEIRALLVRQKSDDNVHQYVRGLLARAKVNHEAAQAPPRDS